jgi:hypothetical protein
MDKNAVNETLKNNIKQWLLLDNEIKLLQKQIKERREAKKNYTQDIVDVMKQNEIDCFDVKDGKLMYTKNKIKAPLSKKHLLSSLMLYFKNDTNMVKDVGEFILNSRQEKVKEHIRKKIKK